MGIPTLRERASGVLLHPISLPGPHGSGDLGIEARRFVDFLAAAGQRWWQMLPVGPPGYGESPYSAQSAFACNPFFVSLDLLAQEGLLDPGSLPPTSSLPDDRVDYPSMEVHRLRYLRAAFEAFDAKRVHQAEFSAFCEANAFWLDEFALFRALKQAHGGAEWTRWAKGFRRRDADALATARRDMSRAIALERFLQFEFDRQWRDLRAYAAARGIALVGDVPIFIAHDSSDVWQHPEAFFLDDEGNPTFVAGVPPDHFSATGQRWGNPLYRWSEMKDTGYAWWLDRLRVTLSRFDVLRLDHFIGYQRSWRIPAGDATAEGGRWIAGPGEALFETVQRELGALPFIAEDLGALSPAVSALRDRFRLPGTNVLQFAFADDSAAAFLPHNHRRRAVVYTGTHDNDTTAGWFHDAGEGASTRSATQTQREREAALRYVGTDGKEIHWDMIRLALASVARLAIFPLQDVLGLGSEARMNRPGKLGGNWAWRFRSADLGHAHAERLAMLTRTYGRSA